MGRREVSPDSKKGQDDLYRLATDEFRSALDRLAYVYEANPDTRRDLLQEIHLQLWRSFESFDSRCSLRTWVYRIAHNVATSHVVRQRRINSHAFVTLEQVEDKASLENIESSTGRQKALARLLSLIQKLDPLDRQLALAYLEDLDAESISEITGLSVTNVGTRIHRIKNVLSRRFFHKGGQHG